MPDPKPRPDETIPVPASAPSPQGTGLSGDTLGVPGPEPVAPVQIGQYVILAELGRGGMGVVYRAEDRNLKREIALKVMLPQYAAHATAKARFIREARAQAKVEHEHVAVIHHVAEQKGIPYLVRPLLKGMTLQAALRANARPPLTEVVRIARETAEGLAAAHEQGLVHRDIKPANIWLEGKKLRVKILDFGLARAVTDTETLVAEPEVPEAVGRDGTFVSLGDTGPVTRAGAIVGTPAYMSPEQGRGLRVDERTDLFSLGVMLYQMTTGELPFRGATTMAVLTALVTETPPAPAVRNASVPPAISDFVMRLLAKDPAERPASAETAADELRAIEQSLTGTARVIALDSVPPLVVAPSGPDPFADLDVTEPRSDSSTEVGDGDAGDEPRPAPRRATAKATRGAFPVWAVALGVVLVVAVSIGIVAKQLGKKPQPDVAKEEPPLPVSKKDLPQVTPKPKDKGLTPERADREALEALHPHVRLTLRLPSGEERHVNTTDPFPDGPGELLSIGTDGRALPPDFATMCLAALARQPSFLSIYDQFQTIRWTEADFAKLAKLPCHKTLTEFRTGLDLTPTTAESLKGFVGLRSLGLLADTADDATLLSITKLLHAQEFLVVRNLGQSGKVTVRGWAAFAGPVVTELVLVTPRGLDKAACEALTRMQNLTGLTIDGAELDGGMLETLAGCGKLRQLNLTRTAVATGAAKHFALFRSVSTLICSFCGPGLMDDDVPHLATLKALRNLSLDGTGVTAAGGKLLSAALPRCHIVAGGQAVGPSDPHFRVATRLLARGGVGVWVEPTGGKEVQVAKPEDLPADPFTVTRVEFYFPATDADLDPLKAVPTIRQLEVFGDKSLTAESLRGLLTAHREKLRRLRLHSLPSADGLDALVNLTHLTSLSILKSPVGDDWLKHLEGLTELDGLDLDSTKVSDAGLVHVGRLKSLTGLVLNSTAITDAGIKHLAGLQKLSLLYLQGTAVSDASVETIAGLRALVELNLTGTRVTEEGVKKLRAALPNCRIAWASNEADRRAAEWILSNGSGVGIAVDGQEVKSVTLAKLPKGPFELRTLNVNRNPEANDENLACLKGLRHLRTAQITNCPATGKTLSYLRDCKNLEAMILYATGITDEGLRELTGFKELKSLNITQLPLTEPAVRALAVEIPQCKIVWGNNVVIEPTKKP